MTETQLAPPQARPDGRRFAHARRSSRRAPIALVSVLALIAAGAALVVNGVPGAFGAGDGQSASAAPECGTVSATLVPSCGAWLGIWPRTRSDGTMSRDLAKNLTSLEDRLGHKITMVSRYYGWGEKPLDKIDEQWRDSGHVLVVDLRARNFATNEYVQWAAIARGEHDAYLTEVAQHIKAFKAKVFFSFNQEPEQELEKGAQVAGTATDFTAAYRHIHDLFGRLAVDNVVWLWWIMGYMGHVGWYPSLYPGDQYVDWVSYDPYDYNSCRKAKYETPAQTVLPFLDWLGGQSFAAEKPIMLSEFGSYGINRGSWYREFGRVIKNAARIKAVIVFNSAPAGACDTRVTASRDNWDGFADLAGDPFFNPVAPSALPSAMAAG